MAWAHCATIFAFLPSTVTNNRTVIIRRKTIASAISLPSSSKKLTKRKNYLRQKLLKTLRKPYTSYPILPQEKSETLETQQKEDFEVSFDRNVEESNEQREELVLIERHTSATAGVAEVSNAPIPFSGRLVLDVLSVYVIQTVFVVCVFGIAEIFKESSDGEGKKREAKLGGLVSEMENGEKKEEGFFMNRMSGAFGKFFGSKPCGFVNVDESQLEAKIDKIRVMAREARESEAKERSSNDLSSSSDVARVNGDEDATIPKIVVPREKSDIEKEVDGRIKKLDKKLRPLREKSVALSVSYLHNLSKVNDQKETQSDNAKLKGGNLEEVKFGSYSPKPENHPKGFQGRKDSGLPKGHGALAQDASLKRKSNEIDVIDLLAREKQDGIQTSSGDTPELKATEEEESLQVIGNDTLKASVSKRHENEEAGQEINLLSSSQALQGNVEKEGSRKKGNRKPRSGFQETISDVVEPRKSSESKAKISRSFKKEVPRKPKFNRLKDKQADIKANLWWKKLPYVLAILLRRSPDPKAPKGLYSLKMDGGLSSYVVFEDRNDANNFCYILESFFEDLGEVSADVVPLSIKEIELLKSSTKKMLVLRKGQLNLYAGQPLTEVEMALRLCVPL